MLLTLMEHVSAFLRKESSLRVWKGAGDIDQLFSVSHPWNVSQVLSTWDLDHCAFFGNIHLPGIWHSNGKWTSWIGKSSTDKDFFSWWCLKKYQCRAILSEYPKIECSVFNTRMLGKPSRWGHLIYIWVGAMITDHLSPSSLVIL